MYTSSEVYSPAPSPYSIAVGRISKDQWLALQEHILDTINTATTATDMAVLVSLINAPDNSFNFMTRDEVQQEYRYYKKEYPHYSPILDDIVQNK